MTFPRGHSSLLLAALLATCVPAAQPGPGTGPLAASAPAFGGDPCALHLATDACRADATHGCTWDTFCRSGAAGPDAGADGGTAAATCTCPPGGTCVARLGGTVSLTIDAVTCASLRPGCTPSGPCTCLAGQGKCFPSETVSDLCLCDDLRQ